MLQLPFQKVRRKNNRKQTKGRLNQYVPIFKYFDEKGNSIEKEEYNDKKHYMFTKVVEFTNKKGEILRNIFTCKCKQLIGYKVIKHNR